MVNKLTLHPTTEDDVIAIDDFEYLCNVGK